jgi:hypothetical protein
MRSMLRSPFLGVALLCAAGAAAEPLDVGAALPALELADQHGESRAIDAAVRIVLFSRDMDGGKVVREALERKGEGAAGLLAERDAVYVADVSRMPGLVRRMIALPRMRRRPYPVLLDEKGAATAAFPSRDGRATVLFLDGLRVTRIAYEESPDAVLRVLEPASGADPQR